MSVGNSIQVGEAVRHKPLPLLTTQNEPVNNLEEVSRSSQSKNESLPFLGGFICGGQLAWRASGSTIEIIDPSTCIRQAAWTFGAILRNLNAKVDFGIKYLVQQSIYVPLQVTCVSSIGIDTVTHVVVGLDLGSEHNHRGMVGILSLRRSRITRAFQFKHKVTNVCMVSGGDKIVDPSTLALELRNSHGLLAVSTDHAAIYLVDLALDRGGK